MPRAFDKASVNFPAKFDPHSLKKYSPVTKRRYAPNTPVSRVSYLGNYPSVGVGAAALFDFAGNLAIGSTMTITLMFRDDEVLRTDWELVGKDIYYSLQDADAPSVQKTLR